MRLTDQEYIELSDRCRAGDIEARNVLICSVYGLMKKMSRGNDDCLQKMVIDLMQSLKKYDGRVSRLTTYVVWLCKRRMYRSNRTESCIYVPEYAEERNKEKLDKARFTETIGRFNQPFVVDDDGEDAEVDVVRWRELFQDYEHLLDDREILILKDILNGQTLESIGQSFGVSKTRIEQVRNACVARIRAQFLADYPEEYSTGALWRRGRLK